MGSEIFVRGRVVVGLKGDAAGVGVAPRTAGFVRSETIGGPGPGRSGIIEYAKE